MCAIHVKNLKETLIESYCKIMRKFIKNLSLLAVVASLGFMMSCNEDEETFDAPILTIESSQLDSEFSFEGTPGTPLSYTVVISSEAGFNTLYEDDAVIATKDPGTTPTTFEHPISKEIPETVGTYTTEYYAVDEAGQESNRITVTIEVVAGVNVYTEKLLFPQSANEESKTFFSTNLGVTVTKNQVDATADPSSIDIDFGFAAGAQGSVWLASPSNYPTFTEYTLEGVWTTLNTTNFKKVTISNEDYLAINTAAEVEAIYTGSTATAEDRKSGFVVGDIFAIQLDETNKGGKYGLVKIVALVDAAQDGAYIESNDYLEIEVIVQE